MGFVSHPKNIITPQGPSRVPVKVTVKAFYKRLTFQERKMLRNSMRDEVADLREDLQRDAFVILDDDFKQQLLDTNLLLPERVDELLVAPRGRRETRRL